MYICYGSKHTKENTLFTHELYVKFSCRFNILIINCWFNNSLVYSIQLQYTWSLITNNQLYKKQETTPPTSYVLSSTIEYHLIMYLVVLNCVILDQGSYICESAIVK